MGATNTTSHYNLSQFVSTDKPAWLQDYNGDMAKIDAGIDAAKVAADTAQTTANAASGAATQNTNDITALTTTVTGQGSNITALQLAVNTINSLIGNGTPTTTDQTIIGAINEINGGCAYIPDWTNGDFNPIDKTAGAHTFTPSANGFLSIVLNNSTLLFYAGSDNTAPVLAAAHADGGKRNGVVIPLKKNVTYAYGATNGIESAVFAH